MFNLAYDSNIEKAENFLPSTEVERLEEAYEENKETSVKLYRDVGTEGRDRLAANPS